MIKLSKDGLEVSHNRYLSDSSTGLIFYLNFLVLDKVQILKLGFLSNVFDKNLLSTDILILILLFFLVTVVGMLLSVFSWCLLEFFYIKFFEKLWWVNQLPLKLIQFSSQFSQILIKNEITYKNWHSSLVIAEEFVALKGLSLDRFLIQRSLRVFLRNLSLLMLVDLFIMLFKSSFFNALIFLSIAFFLMLTAGFLGFFSNVGLMVKYEMTKNKA